MTPIEQIPINSLAWMFGTIACLAMAIRSFVVYHRSYSELTKYILWFSILITLSLIFFGFPSLFTLNEGVLHAGYILGEFFMYLAFIPQAAVLWSLVLRRYLPMYAVTVPVGIVSLATWLYATPNSALNLRGNFVDYSEPGICSFAMGVLFLVLFVPVGYYFIKSTMRQSGFKDKMVTFVLGLVFVGIGVSTAAHLFTVGHAVSPASSVGTLVFFIFLFGSIVWPRHVEAKSVLPEIRQTATSS